MRSNLAPSAARQDRPAQVARKALEHVGRCAKARQQVKTVVRQPHAEPERDQRVRITSRDRQQGRLQPPQPAAKGRRKTEQERRQNE